MQIRAQVSNEEKVNVNMSLHQLSLHCTPVTQIRLVKVSIQNYGETHQRIQDSPLAPSLLGRIFYIHSAYYSSIFYSFKNLCGD